MKKDIIFKDSSGNITWYEKIGESNGVINLISENGVESDILASDIGLVRKVRGKNKRMVLATSEDEADKLLKVTHIYKVYKNGISSPQGIRVVREDDLGFYIRDGRFERLITHKLLVWNGSKKTIPWVDCKDCDNKCIYTYNLEEAKNILKGCRSDYLKEV